MLNAISFSLYLAATFVTAPAQETVPSFVHAFKQAMPYVDSFHAKQTEATRKELSQILVRLAYADNRTTSKAFAILTNERTARNMQVMRATADLLLLLRFKVSKNVYQSVKSEDPMTPSLSDEIYSAFQDRGKNPFSPSKGLPWPWTRDRNGQPELRKFAIQLNGLSDSILMHRFRLFQTHFARRDFSELSNNP